MKRAGTWVMFVVAMLTLTLPATARTRIGDIARVMGVRDNQLVGYGLVIGLQGTGDRTGSGFTEQSMSSLLEELGLTLAPSELNLRNVAAVLVTAELPPFAREGSRVDVMVSSIGTAKNLRGGVLVQTPLRAADGSVYVVAQGALSLGGFEFDGPGGTRVQKNHVTVARIPSGGIVEREVPFELIGGGTFDVVLDRPSFAVATSVTQAIQRAFPSVTPHAKDGGTITIPADAIPGTLGAVGFAAAVEALMVDVDRPSRVVVNERTGTLVAGGDIRIAPVAIAHGGLTIEVNTGPVISQPMGFSMGETIVAPESSVHVEEAGSLMNLPSITTVADLANAFNTLHVTASDMIAIFQALKEVGALDAELVIL